MGQIKSVMKYLERDLQGELVTRLRKRLFLRRAMGRDTTGMCRDNSVTLDGKERQEKTKTDVSELLGIPHG